MAVMTDGPDAGRDQGFVSGLLAPAAFLRRLGVASHVAGAGVSLALIGGVAIWGYQLLMRDVNGIPVIRAMEGPMRISPEDPGGAITSHTGLSVNAIAAVGEAAPPEDRLMLAPAGGELAAEDLELAPPEAALAEDAAVVETVAAPEAAPAALPPLDGAMSADDVLALVDQLAAGAAPMGELAPGDDAPVTLTVAGEAMDDQSRFTVISQTIPGVSRAARPPARPAALNVSADAGAAALAAAVAGAATPAEAAPVVTGAVPAGAALVQLGAFDTAEIAAQEWTRLTGRFGQLLGGKERVIQQAERGGSTFFRLRAMGFADLAEARRLCSALVAENAACVPVMARD